MESQHDQAAGNQDHAAQSQSKQAGKTEVPSGPPASSDARTTKVEGVIARLSDAVGKDRFDRFFGTAQAKVEVRGKTIEVTAPSKFVAEMLNRRFGDALLRVARESIGAEDAGVRFCVDGSAFGSSALGSDVSKPDSAKPGSTEAGAADVGAVASDAGVQGTPGRAVRARSTLSAGTSTSRDAQRRAPSRRPSAGGRSGRPSQHNQSARDDELLTLANFVIGASNRLAYSAAVRVAEGVGRCDFSPLVIHGSCGMGKTHLLRGIAGMRRQVSPGARIRYVTAENFTNGFVMALKGGKLDDFRRSYRALDLLCIDDVHFLARKTQTQSELLHTLDEIASGGARIVLASDAHPRQIQELAEALRSRLLSGAVVRLAPPDRELQVKLIRAISARRGIVLAPEALELITERAGRLGIATGSVSVRDLEGLITQIYAVRKLLPELLGADGSVGLVLVRRALGLESGEGAPTGKARRPVPLEFIRREVSRRLAISESELLGKGRHKRVVLGRALVVAIARRVTTHSFPEIGRALGRVNHSTVVTAHQRIQGRVKDGEIVRTGSDYDGLTYSELLDQVERDIRKASQGG